MYSINAALKLRIEYNITKCIFHSISIIVSVSSSFCPNRKHKNKSRYDNYITVMGG